MEIHLGEQKLKNIWVKVTGMLQQNWAFIDADQTPIVVYFFNDNKMIFDQLEFGSNDIAISGLRWNGFSNAWENKWLFQTYFIYGQMTKIYKKGSSFHKPYSSGKYWEQPPDGFIDEVETVMENNSFNINEIPLEKTKHPKLKVFEKYSQEDSIQKKEKKILKLNIVPDAEGTKSQNFSVTRKRIKQIEDKELRKLKRFSRTRKLKSFDEQ